MNSIAGVSCVRMEGAEPWELSEDVELCAENEVRAEFGDKSAAEWGGVGCLFWFSRCGRWRSIGVIEDRGDGFGGVLGAPS